MQGLAYAGMTDGDTVTAPSYWRLAGTPAVIVTVAVAVAVLSQAMVS